VKQEQKKAAFKAKMADIEKKRLEKEQAAEQKKLDDLKK
jgi:hypothetical protein